MCDWAFSEDLKDRRVDNEILTCRMLLLTLTNRPFTTKLTRLILLIKSCFIEITMYRHFPLDIYNILWFNLANELFKIIAL